MRHVTIGMFIPGLLAIAGSASAAEGLLGEPMIRVAPAGWYASLGGEWRFDHGATSGTTVTSSELNTDDAQVAPMIDVTIGLPLRIDLELGGYYFKTDGHTVLTRPVNFGSVNFVNGDAVNTEATIADAYLAIAYRAVDTPAFWLSIGVAAHVVMGEVKMSSPTQGDHYSANLPMASVMARSGFNLIGTGLSVGGALQWMSLSTSEAAIDLLDVELYVAWSPLPVPLCLFGGYRYLDYAIDVTGNEKKHVDVNIGGPFAGVSFSF